MGLINSLVLAIVLLYTITPFSVLAEKLYTRPSLLDRTKDYAIVLSPVACSAFIFNNGADSYRYICWDSDAQIFPESDGYYRITLYTGFPNDSSADYTQPDYKYDYEWKGYRKVYVNEQGCLRPYKDGWGIPEALGPCPPPDYSVLEPVIINPYRRRQEYLPEMLNPLFKGIHNLITPIFQDQSMINPDNTGGADPNPISNDDLDTLLGLS